MHTSNERDDYIDINWSNIKEESKLNFKKVATHAASTFDTEYDYESITHYSSFAFAKDKKNPTIKAKLELYAGKMGQRLGC
jgi:astacin